MSNRIGNFIIRGPDGVRTASSLVLGRGVPLSTTAGGLPELDGFIVGEIQLMPSGGDDTKAVRDALATGMDLRLGPGTFSVKDPMLLENGQSVRGCGPLRTAVRCPFDHITIFTVTGAGSAIENLALVGPGISLGIGTIGVGAAGATDLRLRDLRIDRLDYGIQLSGTSRVEITSVTARYVTYAAVQATGPGEQMVVSGLSVRQGEGWGLQSTSVDGLSCDGISVRECGGGIHLNGGSAHSLRDIRIAECDLGLQLINTDAASVAGLSVAAGSPLRIFGGRSPTVSGMRSETTGTSPHVLVASGATGVMLTAIHCINPGTPPQYEVDVSGAGGRVLFIQHNFDPARINSGSNFAAL